MPDQPEDFWPKELPDPSDPAPVALLKEQAALLGQRTHGEVEALVKPNAEQGKVYYSLYLKANVLGNYLYKILEIAHPAIDRSAGSLEFTARSMDGGPEVMMKDDNQFRDWLRAQLSSEFVGSAIGNLRRYVRERQAARVG